MIDLKCEICNGVCLPHDVVDFNKSCEEPNGNFLQLSGTPIYYYICNQCGFCFAPEFKKWTFKEFTDKIYNEDYIFVDPDYLKLRPESNAKNIIKRFENVYEDIRHLDYGGGNKVLTTYLIKYKWNSSSYDPFIDKTINIKELGKYDLISAFEVFEHVPDVNIMMDELSILLKDDGAILFSTLLSDGNIEKNKALTWWYASPRNGHISLYSKDSLVSLAKKYNYNIGSFNRGLHLFYKEIPVWAKHLFDN